MKTLAVVLLSALLAGPALAQATDAQRVACTPDVMRLCASHIPNVGAIKGCLRRERPRLSSGCRAVIEAAERPIRTAGQP